MVKVVRLLVQNNAAIDPVDLDGFTPLHLASASKSASPNVVGILLEAGASTTHKDNEGKNALTVAIINRERECARAILESDGWLEALKTDVPDVLGGSSMT